MSGKKRIVLLALSFLALLIVTQPAAMADPTLVYMYLNGSANFTGDNLGNIYTSPYSLNVTRVSDGQNWPTLALSCDDFATDINTGSNNAWYAEEWTSFPADSQNYKFALGSSSATTEVSNTPGVYNTSAAPAPVAYGPYNTEELYYAAALLADKVLLPTSLSNLQTAEYSYALWQLFDSESFLGYQGTPGGSAPNELTADEQTAVNGYLDWALGLAGNYQTVPLSAVFGTSIVGSNVVTTGLDLTVFTPVPSSASQEFITVTPVSDSVPLNVPEASALAFLPFDLLVLFGGILLVRRRILRKTAA
jgi:hypothetical protein